MRLTLGKWGGQVERLRDQRGHADPLQRIVDCLPRALRCPTRTCRSTRASRRARASSAQTIQYHGAADRYLASGATTVATLFSDAVTPTANPAVTLRSVGSGHAAAFVYDLARSVVYTHQGNPAWAATERDGSSPIRPNDLFFPDYVNLDRVAIPQADEQQRLLANIVHEMQIARRPLPALLVPAERAQGRDRARARRPQHRLRHARDVRQARRAQPVRVLRGGLDRACGPRRGATRASA